jgi:HlyD family secretion protein
MKKWLIGALVIALLTGGYLLFGRGSRNAPEHAGLPPVKTEGQVIAEARVVPVRYVTLSLSSGGALAEVRVAEGERVDAGRVLARLDTARQAEAAVAQAEAALQGAEAKLAELRSGARVDEINAARGTLDAAKAHYHQLAAGARPEEREQARMAVEQADGQVRAAEQAVRQADTEGKVADADLVRIELLYAQGAVAEQTVDQVRARVQVDKAADEAARARLDVAKAQAAWVRQQLRLVVGGPRQEEVDGAAADVRRAQALLALLEAGARPETIAAAEADVAVAQANVKAKETLAQTELRAPFAGVVVALVPNLDEFVPPGVPIVRLADTSVWEIETTDLSDLSVARVREGDPVALTFDGIPGLHLTGRVIRVQGFGESKQGDIVYKVTIRPDRQDPRFRWNMTASVEISSK